MGIQQLMNSSHLLKWPTFDVLDVLPSSLKKPHEAMDKSGGGGAAEAWMAVCDYLLHC